MNFDRVKYDPINGKPYYRTTVMSGKHKGKTVKHYGVIRYCISCGIKFFAPDLYIRRDGAKFCSHLCSNSHHPETHNGRWKGGRRKNGRGYIRVMLPGYHDGDERGYVWEHRVVVESHLKRQLTKDEVVHHINQNPSDNRIENLKVMPKWEHMAMHRKLHKEVAGQQ